jgi:hypothetical protein
MHSSSENNIDIAETKSKQTSVYTTEKTIIHLSNPRVRIETNYGSFTLELYPKKHVNQVVYLVANVFLTLN